MIIPRSVVAIVITALIVLSVCVVVSTVAMGAMRAQMWQMYNDCPVKPAR
jgi:hypothetical protein